MTRRAAVRSLGHGGTNVSEPIAAKPDEPLSVAERVARGKGLRAVVPRSSHGDWAPAPDRDDPIALLERQATTRVPELVPIRYGRMASSPFAFYRGAALPMAADLAATPRLGLDVQLCGDAHLSNFGGFAAPDRTLVFDVNDFDETNPGPFEWDLKRLAASFEIAGQSLHLKKSVRRSIVVTATRSYREAMREFAMQSNLDVWYARLDIDAHVAQVGNDAGRAALKQIKRTIRKAKSKDRLKAVSKLTRPIDGQIELVSDPPLIVPIEELLGEEDSEQLDESIQQALRSYRKSLSHDRRHLLETYRYAHVARKVVGVGSVGTRAWIVLFIGRDDQDALILQVKEAEASVLEEFTQPSQFVNHGHRVVEGQRLMQAASDILLGFEHIAGDDGVTRDYYMRQLWDWKASADIDSMTPDTLRIYAHMCGWTLARAHARSGDRVAIGAYLGGSSAFDEAVADFAASYAHQNQRDHKALLDAIESGRIRAETGI
jgi:uncharacterized protein (DUF2252 family)